MLTRDPIEEALAVEEADIQKRLSNWSKFREQMMPIVFALQALEAELNFSGDLNVRVSGDSAKLISVIRVLRTNGFKTDEPALQKNKSYWSANYYKDGFELPVWLSFSSTVCRTVKVGTKMVEQDVYEVQCD